MSTVPDHRNNSPGDTSDPLNGDVAERVLADDAPWKLIQKNCFTRWTNEHLKSVNKHIADLETDLSDGLRLIALVEVLSGKVITQKYTRRPTFRSQKLENITLALKNLERDEGIRLVNIGESDVNYLVWLRYLIVEYGLVMMSIYFRHQDEVWSLSKLLIFKQFS